MASTAKNGPLDVAKIRADFPVLSRKVYRKPLVYLDNAATSQKPQQVIQALVDYYEGYNANIHRGVHAMSIEATDRYEEARVKVGRFINAPTPEHLIFTRNTTESINLVSRTWALSNLKEGDEILLSEAEHHSNLVPWQWVAQETGAVLKFIRMAADYTLDMSDMDNLVTSKTKLVSVTQMSNVLGTIVPVKPLIEAAHRMGALVLLDAAQSVPHMPVDVQDLDCDFLAFSSHKMCGPTGIGILYVKDSVLEEMQPFLRGGDMIREVYLDRSTWNDLPARFEAGTPNIADAIGLGAAVDYLSALGMANVRAHEVQLTSYALERFKGLEGVTPFGTTDMEARGGVISFHVPEIHPHDMGTALDQLGIAIRTGHHCAMPLMKVLQVPATARASFYIYNTEEEVDTLVEGIAQTLRYFEDATRRS
jgi:cysteine desulfurase / selenocysteine lyase